MSTVDQLLQRMVQAEVERALAPITEALAQQQEVLSRFAAALGVPSKRSPGRPKKAAVVPAPKNAPRGAAKVRAAPGQTRSTAC